MKEVRQIPPELLAGLCKSLGGDEGFFRRCMAKDFGEFEPKNKNSFCAWLHKQCIGKWPGERSGGGVDMEKRGAISFHGSPTTDGPWDGPKMVSRVPADRKPLRALHGWVDPSGDPDAKSSYKFPHHVVSQDGHVGAANVRGAIAGIAALNGARGGAHIPESDRRGVYAHLARHIRDAKMEPAPLRGELDDGYERRSYAVDQIVVEDRSDGASYISGYAAVFGLLSADLGGFRERITWGAFTKTLSESDVRALWNHEASFVLGRVKSGTLRLVEDQVGLSFRITPPDTQWARDAVVSIARGDVDQMSFGFRAVREEWEDTSDGPVRTLVEMALREISPVTFPAYPQTSVAVRSLESWRLSMRRCSCSENRGQRLAAVLNRRIDAAGGDRHGVIERMASAAGIEPSTVNQILAGSINCPPIGRLRAFSRVLSVSIDSLVSAAELDGCSYARDCRVEDLERRIRLIESALTI